jgi:hypothetical protein
VIVDLQLRLKPLAMVPNQFTKDGYWNAPLDGERSEVQAAIVVSVVKFVAEN